MAKVFQFRIVPTHPTVYANRPFVHIDPTSVGVEETATSIAGFQATAVGGEIKLIRAGREHPGVSLLLEKVVSGEWVPVQVLPVLRSESQAPQETP